MNYTIELSGSCGKAHCEPGWNWRPGPLAEYDLWCALAGTGTMQLNGETYSIRRGACFLVHPGDRPVAEQQPDDRLTVIFIHFRVKTLPSGSTPEALLPERVVYLDELYELETLLNQALDTPFQQDEWTRHEFDCVMKQALIRLYRARDGQIASSTLSRKQKQAMARVVRRIQEAGGQRLPHDKLAEAVGLTPAYLTRLFKQYTGVSLKQYMTQVRLQRAKHLLTETTMNVSQVSDALGYASIFLFSKQFKQHFGLPPSEFQQKAVPSKPHGQPEPPH